jgi:hypothetical protein
VVGELIVTSAATGGPVEGIVLEVSPSFPGSSTCTVEASATACTVFGGSGHYALRVGAPGDQTIQRDVSVGGTTRERECPTITRETVVVVLSTAS